LLLEGYRGLPRVDLAQLCEIICRASQFIADQSQLVREFDLNPLICTGGNITAVDALVVRAVSTYAFSQTELRKSRPCGAVWNGRRRVCNLPAMTDRLSTLYQDLLGGSYDCVDRIVLNAYFRMGHDPGGFRVWWRALTGSDETLENAYLMRMAGRFSRRVRG